MSDLHQRIVAQTKLLRELNETEQLLRVRGLFELLELSYKDALADVSVGDLAKTQGALKQVTAMKNAIFGPHEGLVPHL